MSLISGSRFPLPADGKRGADGLPGGRAGEDLRVTSGTDAHRGTPQAIPDAYTSERVRVALAQDSRTGELGITVTIAGGKVFLSGQVATAGRRAAVEEVTREMVPGYEIHNGITTARLEQADDSEALS